MEKLQGNSFSFVGPSFKSRTSTFDIERTNNMYIEQHPYSGGKNAQPSMLVPYSGLKSKWVFSEGPIRALYTTATGKYIVVVSGNTVRLIQNAQSTSPVVTVVGTLSTSTGRVSVTDNGFNIFLADGVNGYQIDMTVETLTMALIVDSNYYTGSKTVTYQAGYFILEQADTYLFYISNPDSIDFPSLNTYSAVSNMDNVTAVHSQNEQLYVFGSRSIELWALNGSVTGTSDVFALQSGRVYSVGCSAPYSIQKVGTTFCFVGTNEQGDGMVFSFEGDSPVRISTHALEAELQNLKDLDKATAFTWQENGHSFYALNVPGLNSTYVYDFMTKVWTERTSLVDGYTTRWIGECHAFVGGTHFIGDYRKGTVYALDPSWYLDGDLPIRRERITPHLSSGVGRVFYKTLQIDLEPGSIATDAGEALLHLQVSKDGGKTWGLPFTTTMGKAGEYTRRARFNRLGSGRDMVFRVWTDSPCYVSWLGAFLDVELGNN